MVARYLQKLSHLTPSVRRDNFCKYRATMKFLAPFLKEMDFSSKNGLSFYLRGFRRLKSLVRYILKIGRIGT